MLLFAGRNRPCFEIISMYNFQLLCVCIAHQVIMVKKTALKIQIEIGNPHLICDLNRIP